MNYRRKNEWVIFDSTLKGLNRDTKIIEIIINNKNYFENNYFGLA